MKPIRYLNKMYKMKSFGLLFVFVIFIVTSCSKDELTPIKPVIIPVKVFEEIWKTRIYEAPLENVGSRNAYFYKGVYILAGDHYSHIDPTIYAYDIKTGSKKWKIKQSGNYQEPGYNITGKDHVLIMSDATGIAAFDLEKKQLIWEDLHNDKNEFGLVGQLPILGNFVYKGITEGSFYGPAKMIRYELMTGKKETLVDVPIDGIWSHTISPPAFWTDTNNDTIMIIINGKSNIDYSPQNSPTDLWAVNLSTKKVVWKIDSIMAVRTNLGSPPVIHQNSVIFGGDWSVYSVDIPTGKVKWRTQFPELGNFGNFNRTGLLLAGENVYGNPDGYDIFSLDAETGNVKWHNKTLAANCTPRMLYNDGMLITTSIGTGSVLIYDAESGSLIHKEFSSIGYHTDVVYDKETNMYFVQDFASAVGFRINKPK